MTDESHTRTADGPTPGDDLARRLTARAGWGRAVLSPWVQRTLSPDAVQSGRERPPAALSEEHTVGLVNRISGQAAGLRAFRPDPGSVSPLTFHHFAGGIVQRFPPVAEKYQVRPAGQELGEAPKLVLATPGGGTARPAESSSQSFDLASLGLDSFSFPSSEGFSPQPPAPRPDAPPQPPIIQRRREQRGRPRSKIEEITPGSKTPASGSEEPAGVQRTPDEGAARWPDTGGSEMSGEEPATPEPETPGGESPVAQRHEEGSDHPSGPAAPGDAGGSRLIQRTALRPPISGPSPTAGNRAAGGEPMRHPAAPPAGPGSARVRPEPSVAGPRIRRRVIEEMTPQSTVPEPPVDDSIPEPGGGERRAATESTVRPPGAERLAPVESTAGPPVATLPVIQRRAVESQDPPAVTAPGMERGGNETAPRVERNWPLQEPPFGAPPAGTGERRVVEEGSDQAGVEPPPVHRHTAGEAAPPSPATPPAAPRGPAEASGEPTEVRPQPVAQRAIKEGAGAPEATSPALPDRASIIPAAAPAAMPDQGDSLAPAAPPARTTPRISPQIQRYPAQEAPPPSALPDRGDAIDAAAPSPVPRHAAESAPPARQRSAGEAEPHPERSRAEGPISSSDAADARHRAAEEPATSPVATPPAIQRLTADGPAERLEESALSPFISHQAPGPGRAAAPAAPEGAAPTVQRHVTDGPPSRREDIAAGETPPAVRRRATDGAATRPEESAAGEEPPAVQRLATDGPALPPEGVAGETPPSETWSTIRRAAAKAAGPPSPRLPAFQPGVSRDQAGPAPLAPRTQRRATEQAVEQPAPAVPPADQHAPESTAYRSDATPSEAGSAVPAPPALQPAPGETTAAGPAVVSTPRPSGAPPRPIIQRRALRQAAGPADAPEATLHDERAATPDGRRAPLAEPLPARAPAGAEIEPLPAPGPSAAGDTAGPWRGRPEMDAAEPSRAMPVLPQARIQAKFEADAARSGPLPPGEPAGSGPLPLASARNTGPGPGPYIAPRAEQRLPLARPVVSVDTIQRRPVPGIQRVAEAMATGSASSTTSCSSTAAPEAGRAPDLDDLARRIYPIIRRMLAVERERLAGSR